MPTTRGLVRGLHRRLRDCIARWQLIEPGDRVLVAMSGGKDSYALAELLLQRRRATGGAFSLVAVHLDAGQPGHDATPLLDWLRASELDFEILREDLQGALRATLSAEELPCSLCSRLRRGVLYSAAQRLGCNKLALGHHRDDGLATFLMNLFFSGKLQAMPARYRTDDGSLEVIRPLLDCEEARLAALAELRGYPLLTCGSCAPQVLQQREEMGKLLAELSRLHPNLKAVMAHALGNVRVSHLLDRELQQRLERAQRAGLFTHEVSASATPRRFAAEPVVARHSGGEVEP